MEALYRLWSRLSGKSLFRVSTYRSLGKDNVYHVEIYKHKKEQWESHSSHSCLGYAKDELSRIKATYSRRTNYTLI